MDFRDHVSKELLVNIIKAIPSNIFFKDMDQKYVFSSHYSDQLDRIKELVELLRKHLPEEYIEELNP